MDGAGAAVFLFFLFFISNIDAVLSHLKRKEDQRSGLFWMDDEDDEDDEGVLALVRGRVQDSGTCMRLHLVRIGGLTQLQ